MKQEVFTIEPECLGCDAESDDLEIREFGNHPAAGYVSECVNTISGEIFADSKDFDEICYEVAHMQSNSP